MNEEIIEPELSIGDELELRQLSTKIKSRINKDITEDFVLAKLTEQDIVGIRDLTHDAYLAKSIIERKQHKKVWVYDNKWKQYKKVPLSELKKTRIRNEAKRVFDTYMVKLYMTAILKRNLDKNVILKYINKISDEIKTEENANNEEKNLLKKLVEGNKK